MAEVMKPLHVGIRGVDTGWLQQYLLELGYDVESTDAQDEGESSSVSPFPRPAGLRTPTTQGGNHIAEGITQ